MRWTRKLAAVGLALISTVLSILAVEWLARQLGVQSTFGRMFAVRDLPTRLVDGVVLWSGVSPRYDQTDLLRAAGDEGALTILGLGDSIMYGVELEKEQTYLEQARLVAARSGKPIHVLNIAVPGFNTRQEDVAYKELEDHIRPDLVIVHFWGDDSRQYRMSSGYVLDYGDVSSDGHLLVRALPLPLRLNDYLLINSRLYGLLTELVVRNTSKGWQADWPNVSEPLVAIHERAERAGARLLVLVSPDLGDREPRSISELGSMRDLGRQQGFEVIDLREWLDGAASAQVGLDSCHFNAYGHRLLGEHLAAYLLEHDRDANPVAAE